MEIFHLSKLLVGAKMIVLSTLITFLISLFICHLGAKMIVLSTLITLLISLFICHFFLLKKPWLTQRHWECVDYLWYGFGAFALLLSSLDLTRAYDVSALESRMDYYAERAQTDIRRTVDEIKPTECRQSKAVCLMLDDTLSALNETKTSLDWPFGPVIFKRQEFSSWNEFLLDRAKYYKAEIVPNILAYYTSRLLDVRSELRDRQKELNKQFMPLWLRIIWPHVLALVLGMRISKVTYKVFKST